MRPYIIGMLMMMSLLIATAYVLGEFNARVTREMVASYNVQ
jgi:hypothetical protein